MRDQWLSASVNHISLETCRRLLGKIMGKRSYCSYPFFWQSTLHLLSESLLTLEWDSIIVLFYNCIKKQHKIYLDNLLVKACPESKDLGSIFKPVLYVLHIFLVRIYFLPMWSKKINSSVANSTKKNRLSMDEVYLGFYVSSAALKLSLSLSSLYVYTKL